MKSQLIAIRGRKVLSGLMPWLWAAGVLACGATQAQTSSGRSPVAPVQAPQPAPVTGSLLSGGHGSQHGHVDAASLRMGPGLYRCESNRYVAVRRVTDDGKTAVLFWNQREHTLRAVETQSGALRFEDAVSGLTWITIVGKSMLLDTVRGQQLANDCRG